VNIFLHIIVLLIFHRWVKQEKRNMKSIISLMFAIALIPGLGLATLCNGQTMAIGHVSAEVIESVSASSQAVTSLALGTSTSGTSSSVELGAMTINSGSNVTVGVVIKPAALSDSQGNGFTIDPALNHNSLASVAQSNGSQTLQLNGTANLAADQASGLYQGSYTVVFAYN
jgi:hypothetical protein